MSNSKVNPVVHHQEDHRLAMLNSLGILDTPPEERFDVITELVCDMLECPISTITLIDKDRQWHKSTCGMPGGEVPRDQTFCTHTILENPSMIIDDVTQDSRFKLNPFVIGDPGIRAYAGIPLITSNNLPIGTLCAIDKSPRTWSEKEIKILAKLAKLVERELCINSQYDIDKSKLLLQAHIDPFLSCLDLFGFEKVISDDLRNRNTDKYSPSIISYKINNIESINYEYGFTFKNQILLESVTRFQNIIKNTNEIVGRLNRETIASYHFDIADKLIAQLADEIHGSLSEVFVIDEKECVIDISVIIFDNLQEFKDVKSILHANNDLHKVYSNNTKSVLSYTKDGEADAIRRTIEVRKKVKNALLENKFSVHYQPKVSTQTLKLTGFEALLRWIDPELGYVSPMDIVSFIEEMDLSNELSTWVIKYVINDLIRWKNVGVPLYPISINLSEDQLKLPGFSNFVENELSGHSIGKSLIEFEILERSLVDHIKTTRKNIVKLNNIGVNFSIDDFGTGYSALKLLNVLPLNAIKIDRSFIKNIVESTEESSLAHSIITIGHDAGLKVVAEGVETYDQYLILRALDCDQIQGYYFSKPISGDAVFKLLYAGGQFQAMR